MVPYRAFASFALATFASAGCASEGEHVTQDDSIGITFIEPDEGSSGSAAAVEASASREEEQTRQHLLERVDDVGIIQLYADGFENLSLEQKQLVWHLYQAALAGRDIYVLQKCAEGLEIRELFEEILTHADGIDADTLRAVRKYAKLFWLNNSPYHYTTSRKFVLETDERHLVRAADRAAVNGAALPTRKGEKAAALVRRLAPMLFDPAHKPMVTDKNPQGGADPLLASAMTFYGDGVTSEDLDGFEERHELNSTVRKTADGSLVEDVWRAGGGRIDPGLYAEQIEAVIGHLEDAMAFAPEPTVAALEALVRFYRTGAREDRVAYDVAWVADAASPVDTINGFIEVYVDPRGRKGAWEALVFYEDPKKAALIKTIADNAQWFEDHMPFGDEFKKPEVKGISARSIDVVIETGDSGPITPIGINLPNDNAVREEYGSKSVSLANVVEGYAKASPSTAGEFAWDEAEAQRAETWGSLVGDMLTNMHEVIGHASGRMSDELQGVDPASLLKEYHSALEEARSDLVGLYFIGDPKLNELGLISDSETAALACYERYVQNACLLQLRRVKQGDKLEQDHMRNRHLVARWIEAHSNAIEERERDGETYYVVTDTAAFREAAGRLLALCQKLKSTGDYEGVKALFDPYLTFDPALRDEVVQRYAALGVPSYSGFVMPRLTPLEDARGQITDIHLSYPMSLEQQMLEWSGRREAPGPAAD
jgi:dipeptidyl-peptidase-3